MKYMIPKEIDKISESDLQALIDNSVLEQKTLDYKKLLPGNKDEDKKEFLADVSSFANASGGDLIYGITQDNATGFPKELTGIESENVDQEIQRLESIIREGLDPRIPSVEIWPVNLSNAKNILVIRVHKSWISPHRIRFKSYHKFYSRNSNGKYELDVGELRIAFTLSDTIVKKIRQFREDRIAHIFAAETPVPFVDSAKIVLHLIPFVSFNAGQHYEIDKIASDSSRYMSPIYCRGWSYRYNLDGFLTYSVGNSTKSHSYVQLFRNGIVEAVEGLILSNGSQLYIPSVAFERELIESTPRFLAILKTLNVELPVFAFLTLISVKGYWMGTGRRLSHDERLTIDKDVLLLPEAVVEDYNVKAEELLRTCFDSIWNACGFSKSMNYDENGKWADNRY